MRFMLCERLICHAINCPERIAPRHNRFENELAERVGLTHDMSCHATNFAQAASPATQETGLFHGPLVQILASQFSRPDGFGTRRSH